MIDQTTEMIVDGLRAWHEPEGHTLAAMIESGELVLVEPWRVARWVPEDEYASNLIVGQWTAVVRKLGPNTPWRWVLCREGTVVERREGYANIDDAKYSAECALKTRMAKVEDRQ